MNMKVDIMPRELQPSFPSVLSWDSLFNHEDWLMPNEALSGLSMSEDDKNFFIEAALPGIDPKNIEVTFDKGVLWIRGEAEEEEENKKRQYYRKASRSFSYQAIIPDTVDEISEPQVVNKNGMLKVTFQKLVKSEPKKLKVKSE